MLSADDRPHARAATSTSTADTDADLVIGAAGLTKRFDPVTALAGLDLQARSGQVTAVLGPNGAGKSTLVRAVATLRAPDGGRLTVAGIDAARQPERVAV